jgi:hypothetical protein
MLATSSKSPRIL